jgi:hypothetical protein
MFFNFFTNERKSPSRDGKSWRFLQAEYSFFELIMAGKNEVENQIPPG